MRPNHQLTFTILANSCFSLSVRAALVAPWFDIEARFPSSPVVGSIVSTHDTRTLHARATSDAVHDKFFIPAIVAMGVVVGLVVLCLYKIGWCFNREQRDKRYSRTAPPVPTHLRPPADPTIPQSARVSTNLEGANSWNRRQSNLQRKPPPEIYGNIPPSRPAGAEYPAQPLGAFQARPPTAQVAMSVLRTAPSVQDTNHGYWTQEATRRSTLSSGQSSTQLGSAEPPTSPTTYQPYAGFTQTQPYPQQNSAYPSQQQSQVYAGQNPQYPGQQYSNPPQNTPNIPGGYPPAALSYTSSSPSSSSPSENRPPPGTVSDSFYGPYQPKQQVPYGYGASDLKKTETQWDGGNERAMDGSDGGRPNVNTGAEASSMEPPGYRTDGVPTTWYHDQKSGLKAALG